MAIRRSRYRPRLRHGLASVALLAFFAAPVAAQNGDGGLIQSISHRARALHPGEVVVLNVRIDGPTRSLTGSAFGHELRFFPAGPANVSSALIGVDLTVDPGAHPVTVRAEGAGGAVDERTYTLEIEPKQFPTRELTVNPSFVDPPAEVIERIQREARQLAAIFPVASADRLWSGGFLRPVPGAATSAFGRRSVFNGQPRSPHSGADFRAAEGTPILAPNDGVVVLAADLYFSGNVVILDHGWGLYSYFAHLSAIDVAEGDPVSQGDTVGKVGATGRVTGPHLHWTVRLNDARVDPVALMELFPADGAP